MTADDNLVMTIGGKDNVDDLSEPALFRMIYVSRIRYISLFDYQFFAKLMQKSEKNNRRAGISGFLCFANGFFYGYIEGSEQNLTNLKNRLLSDSRHHDFKLIDFSSIQQRQFIDHLFSFVFMERYYYAIDEENPLKDFIPFNPREWTLEQHMRLVHLVQSEYLVKINSNNLKNKNSESKKVTKFEMFRMQCTLLPSLLKDGNLKSYRDIIIGYALLAVVLSVLFIMIIFKWDFGFNPFY